MFKTQSTNDCSDKIRIKEIEIAIRGKRNTHIKQKETGIIQEKKER
jgi:hypothetical protein